MSFVFYTRNIKERIMYNIIYVYQYNDKNEFKNIKHERFIFYITYLI